MMAKNSVGKAIMVVVMGLFGACIALALVINLVGPKAHAEETVTQPSTMSSLQPFVRFDEGEGHGYASQYVVRNKTQFVAWLRTGQKLVDCSVFVRQIAQAHPGFPGEACEGSAHEIETSTDYAVVTCADQMLKDNWLAVTDTTGKKFGVWHRRCYEGEQLLTYKGRPVASTTCGNPLIPMSLPRSAKASAPAASAFVPASQPQVTPLFATNACPNGFTLFANAWSLNSLGGLRAEAEKLTQDADARESEEAMKIGAYRPDDFSRTMGKRLRNEVKTRALITADLPIRYLDPQTAKVVRELGTIHMVRGVGSFRFSEDPRPYVIGVIFPPDFVSPAMSGGERRLRMFGYEWESYCAMNVHGALVP